jgi:hypothetical protein
MPRGPIRIITYHDLVVAIAYTMRYGIEGARKQQICAERGCEFSDHGLRVRLGVSQAVRGGLVVVYGREVVWKGIVLLRVGCP